MILRAVLRTKELTSTGAKNMDQQRQFIATKPFPPGSGSPKKRMAGRNIITINCPDGSYLDVPGSGCKWLVSGLQPQYTTSNAPKTAISRAVFSRPLKGLKVDERRCKDGKSEGYPPNAIP